MSTEDMDADADLHLQGLLSHEMVVDSLNTILNRPGPPSMTLHESNVRQAADRVLRYSSNEHALEFPVVSDTDLNQVRQLHYKDPLSAEGLLFGKRDDIAGINRYLQELIRRRALRISNEPDKQNNITLEDPLRDGEIMLLRAA
ncbi:hypothetical protein BDQ17DRAFT_1433084 [Cyathus striatus]|nr:hypothetical protein BDQ17DRAFT_1433084 [Cyathus striatus]